jgi:uncharacterized protein YdiU (UPF0061 family)
MPFSSAYRPAPRLGALGPEHFDPVTPARFPRHVLRHRNQRWAARVGLGDLTAGEWERHFAAFEPLPDNVPVPLALRYHGHQFMSYNPNLGDGRGFLFAQLVDQASGRLLDLGTKGSGRTPWSRDGDGRLTLKGGVRETLASEMLEALGVDTSKAWSLFETGEDLVRGDEPSPTRSSVLVRLSHSHVRFGTFQRHAYHGDEKALRALLEFCVENYFPGLAASGARGAAGAFLREVSRRSAALCASWFVAGFVHGVLNTDNMNVTGESFDYGPFRFLPAFDPAFVAAYFDHGGLYAFGRQPGMVLWNLQRLADALEPVSGGDDLPAALQDFDADYEAALRVKFLRRLGVRPRRLEDDAKLFEHCYAFLESTRAPLDRFFFDWYGGPASAGRALEGPGAALYAGGAFAPVRRLLEAYAPARPERLATPYFAREAPCSLLIEEVEAIWRRIAEADDWSLFEAKLRAIGELREAS